MWIFGYFFEYLSKNGASILQNPTPLHLGPLDRGDPMGHRDGRGGGHGVDARNPEAHKDLRGPKFQVRDRVGAGIHWKLRKLLRS